jgi:hypothetical protein
MRRIKWASWTHLEIGLGVVVDRYLGLFEQQGRALQASRWPDPATSGVPDPD